MIKVAIAGCLGRMGSAVVNAVGSSDDMDVVAGVDPNISATAEQISGQSAFPLFETVEDALANVDADVLVDFTQPSAVGANVEAALARGVNCVVGTTGLSQERLDELASSAKGDACLFYAPNFTTGAVLMMEFAKVAAPYFPQAEVIEYHHCNKKDAPSGTAVNTARAIADARGGKPSEAPGSETELEGCDGARGALVDGIPVHSVRSMGFVANQDVIFGSPGQTLTIRHESWDRESYMPGVLLGIRSVGKMSGLVVGLDTLMGLS